MIDRYTISRLQDLPIEQVAEELGLHVSRHKAICPFHDDTRPSLTFDTRRNRYRCFVCDAKGGVIDFVMNTLGKNFIEACRWLGADTDTRERRVFVPRPKPRTEDVKPDIPYLTRLMAQPVLNQQAERFLFDERRLSREVVEQLGISSISYSCPMSSGPKPSYYDGPALLIPYRDINANLMSVQSRYLGTDDKPRFRFPKGSSCHIFNLPMLKTMAPGESLFLSEGVSDCLALLSAGFKAIAIPSATLLKREDTELLQDFSLHIYPDQDAAGQSLYLQLLALFPNIVRHDLPKGIKDIGQYYAIACTEPVEVLNVKC